MFKVLGICLLFMYCVAEEEDGSKIVGGQSISINEVPYMAIYRPIGQFKYHCGASIITEQFVVSAAHCNEPIPMAVTVGTDKAESGGQEYKIEEVFIHPLYGKTKYQYEYDVIVIKLTEQMTFTTTVSAVELAPQNVFISDNEIFLVTGFGETNPSLREPNDSSNQLLGVKVPHVNLEECRRRLNGLLDISDQMICAGGEIGKDSCQGDSGGPLVMQKPNEGRVLVGIVSFGHKCARDHPGVYTRVSAVVDFIKKIIQKKSN